MKKPIAPETVVEEMGNEADLPEGWATASVGTVVGKLVDGSHSPPPKQSSGVPMYSARNIENGRLVLDDFRYISKQSFQAEHARTQVAPGDVLLTIVGSIGRSVVVPAGVEPFALQRSVAVLKPIEINPSFLMYQFQAPRSQKFFEEKAAGTAQKGVYLRTLGAMPMLVAPSQEQDRIVTKANELCTQVEAVGVRLDKVPKILKAFRQSVLAAACSGRLTEDWREEHPDVETGNACLKRVCGTATVESVPDGGDPIELPHIPETWAWSSCEALCDRKRDVTYGVIKLGVPVESGIPTLRSSDVRWLYIDPENVKRISPKIAAQYGRTFLQGGELLITVRGSLGGIAVASSRMAGFNISREVAMVPLRSEFDAQFFCYAVASIWSQNWLSEVTKGVAYTGVNIRDLKRLPLGVPPIAEQREIVRRVEALFQFADKIEERVAAATRRTDKLTQAILSKAFRGELVPTEAELARQEGRDYEPASALLERIRADREKAAASHNGTRRRVTRRKK